MEEEDLKTSVGTGPRAANGAVGIRYNGLRIQAVTSTRVEVVVDPTAGAAIYS